MHRNPMTNKNDDNGMRTIVKVAIVVFILFDILVVIAVLAHVMKT